MALAKIALTPFGCSIKNISKPSSTLPSTKHQLSNLYNGCTSNAPPIAANTVHIPRISAPNNTPSIPHFRTPRILRITAPLPFPPPNNTTLILGLFNTKTIPTLPIPSQLHPTPPKRMEPCNPIHNSLPPRRLPSHTNPLAQTRPRTLHTTSRSKDRGIEGGY